MLAEREVVASANDLFLCTDRKDWQKFIDGNKDLEGSAKKGA